MKNWTPRGSLLSVKDFQWAKKAAWAGQVVEKKGKFYWYGTVHHDDTNPGKAIGVAVADSPLGPFHDARGSALVTERTTPSKNGWDDIDPTVLTDKDGTSYLCWGNPNCYFVKLKPNMIDLDGPIQKIELPNYTKGPWLHRRGDTCYLTYAAFAHQGTAEKICYATAPKITGPWTYRGILTGFAKNSYTIHPAIIELKRRWYLLYHNANLTLNGQSGATGRRSVEGLNYAADGGLYAEMVQNRSFEYSPIVNNWSALTSWTVVKEGEGRVNVRTGSPLNANNPHYVSVFVEKGEVGLRSEGFDGMVLKRDEPYDLSLFACAFSGKPGPITVRLEDKDGKPLASATLTAPKEDWAKLTATLTPTSDADAGRLVVLTSGTGATGLDMVPLFPRKTFKGRPNGLRADLAQAIADLGPNFVRFPGGCVVHGGWLGLSALCDWKKTVGPVEGRKVQPNHWGYYQTAGVGYFEYFQFCEDIGTKPLPVVPVAVSCQNTDYNWGKGQEALPLSEMKAHIQDVPDLVEYAKGPATSKWGKVRAAAGHPKPFNLEYLAIGNEEAITPVFESRLKMIHDAVKARYLKLKLIGTADPGPAGTDYDAGWKFARKERLEAVDEHYYEAPRWFWNNLTRYDGYDRSEAKVYVEEYAAHDRNRENTFRSALAEGAYLTSSERNGDVVTLSSYAPLLAKEGHTQWGPDLIYFDNKTVVPSVNYDVQRLFISNVGDPSLPAVVEEPTGMVASSVVQDSKSGDVIVKIVSRSESPIWASLDLSSVKGLAGRATRTTLAGDPMAQNAFGKPASVLPKDDQIPFATKSEVELPAHSLTVLRIKTR